MEDPPRSGPAPLGHLASAPLERAPQLQTPDLRQLTYPQRGANAAGASAPERNCPTEPGVRAQSFRGEEDDGAPERGGSCGRDGGDGSGAVGAAAPASRPRWRGWPE